MISSMLAKLFAGDTNGEKAAVVASFNFMQIAFWLREKIDEKLLKKLNLVWCFFHAADLAVLLESCISYCEQK